MAEHTRVAFGDGNRGFQVGLNSGSITNEFHLPPGKANFDHVAPYRLAAMDADQPY